LKFNKIEIFTSGEHRPVVVGSLPTTARRNAGNFPLRTFPELVGKVPEKTGW
jgi:hypothetical protein